MTKRIALVATHPVQYQACWYRAMASSPGLELDVLFCHRATPQDQASAGFGVAFDWDIPLLDGYSSQFLNNISQEPSPCTFRGADTPEIGNILRNSRYDAVLIAGWHFKSAWQAIYAAWRSGIPVLVRSDSHLHTRRSLAKILLKKPVYTAAISRFDACLAAGKWAREYFLEYGAKPGRVFTVPHCVDESLFDSGALRDDWRRQFGFSPDQCVFLFSGKFIPEKQPLDFVAAIAMAHRAGANVRGVMAGDGDLRSECESLAEKTGAPIHFTGFLNQTEIRRAYSGCDVLILPSNSETWGLVVNEAMTSGRPCIVSDQVGCGPDLIEAGVTGDVFKAGDVSSLARLIERYSHHLDITRSMGAATREKIAAYSVRTAVQSTKDALEAVC